MRGLAVLTGTLMQMAGIAVLTGIALKRNNDCYKAQNELIDTQHELAITKISGIIKDAKIRELEKELKELKKD